MPYYFIRGKVTGPSGNYYNFHEVIQGGVNSKSVFDTYVAEKKTPNGNNPKDLEIFKFNKVD